MAENMDLREEMEDYVKQHDLMRLFERLATSIMYDRPEDLNKYAADWLTKIKNARPQLEDIQSSISLGSKASGSVSVKSGTSVAKTRDSVLTQDSQGSLHSTRSKGFRQGRVSNSQPEVATIPAIPEETKDGAGAFAEDFDPYIFSPENIPIFYGMLDPLGEGFISVQHFREVTSLLDLERHVDWKNVGEEVRREDFCALLTQAFKDDLEDLQKYSGELPEVIVPEEELPQEGPVVPEVPPDGDTLDAEQPDQAEPSGDESDADDETEEDETDGTISEASVTKKSKGSIGSRTSMPSKTSSSAIKANTFGIEEVESEEASRLTAKIP